MRLTEEEKKDILSKYSADTSNELLTYLKRHFPVREHQVDFMDNPFKWILVRDKLKPLMKNKKYLVDVISSEVEEMWISLGIPTIRKTVKKYLDGIM